MFSKRGSLRNHLRTHRDQMYLNEAGLFYEENTNISGPSQETDRPFMRNEQDLMLEDSYRQVREPEFCSFTELQKIIDERVIHSL